MKINIIRETTQASPSIAFFSNTVADREVEGEQQKKSRKNFPVAFLSTNRITIMANRRK